MNETKRIDTSQNFQEMLKLAIVAAQGGRRDEAYRLLRRVVESDPSDVVAWFWLAGVTDQPAEALAALRRVEQLKPDHPRLADAMRWARMRASRTDATQPVPPSAAPVTASESSPTTSLAGRSTLRRRLVISLVSLAVVLVIGLLAVVVWGQLSFAQAEPPPSPTPDNEQRLLALQPELNAALAESRWEDAVAVLQVMRALVPGDLVLERQLALVYYQLAMERRDVGDLESAAIALDESLKIAPDDQSVQKEQRLLLAYIQGVQHHQAGDWQAVIRALAPIRLEAPHYLDVVELLYSAYYNLGLSQQAAGDLIGAQASYQAAVELMPDEPLARKKADEVAWLLRPPTPTPIPTPLPTPTPTPVPITQRIVVDVSEQRMYVYDGDGLRWEWVVSTGEPGRDTAIGNFAVQSKIENAYASTWNLDMPYWLGIYWSGSLENGIHALPIQRSTGYKLWDGYLGQRVSYGCVILSDENARTLFNWAKIGTPVTIQP